MNCGNCGSENFEEDSAAAEVVCINCGLVVEDGKVDESAEYRSFNAEEEDKKARAGKPLTYTKHDMGLSTEIGRVGEVKNVSDSKKSQYYRLRKWHKRLTNSKSKNMGFAFSELNTLISNLNLPESVHEESARLYGKAVDQSLVSGRSIENVVSSIVYIVARKHDAPRTLDEISVCMGIEKKELGQCYRYVARELGLRILPVRPGMYVSRFAERLDVSGCVQSSARDLIDDAADRDLLSGKNPTGIAAAALYIACLLEDEKRTQKEVADVAGVTEVTVRNRYRELVDELGDDGVESVLGLEVVA